MKYTSEVLEAAVKQSFSISGVLRSIGIKGGGSHTHISKRIKQLGIDTSHFKRQGENLREFCFKKKPWQEILVISQSDKRTPAFLLRRSLIEMGREHRCEASGCSVKDSWLEQKITLDVDHINGNWQDNSPENLRFLCPNCHRQTETYGNKPRKSKPGKRVPHLNARKCDRPPLDIIRAQVEADGYAATGRRYGVSDNAIRKWLK